MRPLSPQLMALHKIKNLLQDPENWTQGLRHRPRDQGCGSYCILGAIIAVTDDPFLQAQLCDRFRELLPTYSIPLWNDRAGTTHADVIELIEQAILNQEMADAA